MSGSVSDFRFPEVSRDVSKRIPHSETYTYFVSQSSFSFSSFIQALYFLKIFLFSKKKSENEDINVSTQTNVAKII